MKRVIATQKAKEIIDILKQKNGDLMFHQSGGCCDGSAPMCYPKGEFILGSQDLCLGEVFGCKFYMAKDQFQYYRNMQICIDVTKGRGSSFSIEIPLGVRFMTVSKVVSDEDMEKLDKVVNAA